MAGPKLFVIVFSKIVYVLNQFSFSAFKKINIYIAGAC